MSQRTFREIAPLYDAYTSSAWSEIVKVIWIFARSMAIVATLDTMAGVSTLDTLSTYDMRKPRHLPLRRPIRTSAIRMMLRIAETFAVAY
jgi:hypothetical protein